MEREAIGIGATIEEAQQAACRQLGMETHEVEFEVLQMPEKKKFGLFGGAPAKVRAYISITPASAAADYLREILEKMGAQGSSLPTRSFAASMVERRTSLSTTVKENSISVSKRLIVPSKV